MRNPHPRDVPIEDLDLTVRTYNSLKRTGITTIGEVLEMLERGPQLTFHINNFGEKSLAELVTRLRDKGYLPPDDEMAAPIEAK